LGIGNVRLVWAEWTHLPDRSFRALSWMAYRTKDEDVPPMFWGGREELAFALGRKVPPEPHPADTTPRAVEHRRQRAADFEAVKVAVRGLTSKGAILLVRKASGSAPAVYSLHLAEPGKGEPSPPGRVSLPLGKDSPTPGGRVILPDLGGVGGETEKRTKEERDEEQEPNSSNVTSLLAKMVEKATEPRECDPQQELNRQLTELQARFPNDFRENS